MCIWTLTFTPHPTPGKRWTILSGSPPLAKTWTGHLFFLFQRVLYSMDFDNHYSHASKWPLILGIPVSLNLTTVHYIAMTQSLWDIGWTPEMSHQYVPFQPIWSHGRHQGQVLLRPGAGGGGGGQGWTTLVWLHHADLCDYWWRFHHHVLGLQFLKTVNATGEADVGQDAMTGARPKGPLMAIALHKKGDGGQPCAGGVCKSPSDHTSGSTSCGGLPL